MLFSVSGCSQRFPGCNGRIRRRTVSGGAFRRANKRFDRITSSKTFTPLIFTSVSDNKRNYFQNEIENLKQAMADMEEKVQYQSDERLRDVNEVLENCQTRVSVQWICNF